VEEVLKVKLTRQDFFVISSAMSRKSFKDDLDNTRTIRPSQRTTQVKFGGAALLIYDSSMQPKLISRLYD
jgi:hypothetical protein